MTVEYFNCVPLDSPDNTWQPLFSPPRGDRDKNRFLLPCWVCPQCSKWTHWASPSGSPSCRGHKLSEAQLTEDIKGASDVWHALKHLPQVALPQPGKPGTLSLCPCKKHLQVVENVASLKWPILLGGAEIQALWSSWGRRLCAKPRRRGWAPRGGQGCLPAASLAMK